MVTYHFEDEDGREITVSPRADEDEAAAIVAAIEQMLVAQAGHNGDSDPVDPWIRALRFDAIKPFLGRPSPDAPRDTWVAMGRVRR